MLAKKSMLQDSNKRLENLVLEELVRLETNLERILKEKF